jgi:TM2 domain-containing membrane protein YozV
MVTLIWILVFLAFWIAGTLILGWIINYVSLADIQAYNDRLDRHLREAKPARLLPTRSRILNRPDL